MYKYVSKLNKSRPEAFVLLQRQRQIDWRAESAIHQIEYPTNVARARSLGYRAKQGIVLVRVRVPRGGKQRPSIRHGRRSRNLGQNFVMGKNFQWIAEERANKRFNNLEVLNSYNVGKDGLHYWFEVIMIDPHHPAVKKDPKLKNFTRTGRVYRGITSAGRKSRGLMYSGKGAEKVRPSLNAHKDQAK